MQDGPVVDDIFVEGAPGIAFKKPVYASGVASIAFEGKLDAPLTGQVLDLTLLRVRCCFGRHVLNGAPIWRLTDSTGLAFENSSMWALLPLPSGWVNFEFNALCIACSGDQAGCNY